MQPVRRLLVISDIHGQIETFKKLLDKSGFDREKDLLFLLGDYVDRGKDPKAVIKQVRTLENQGAIVLKGNHEDLMERALSSLHPDAIKNWAYNGGAQTLASYGLSIEGLFSGARNGIKPDLPDDLQDDLKWVGRLNNYAETDHYLFVHAGVDPDKPVAETDEHTLLWIRTPFFTQYHGSKTVLFGHTPTIRLHGSNDVYFGKNNIIGIDGGCVYGGQLNCLELPSKNVYHVQPGSL